MSPKHACAAAAAALTSLCAPAAASAAAPSFKVAVPKAGDVGVAHVVLAARKAPRLVLANKRSLPPGTLAVGGVKRLGKSRHLASLVLVRRSGSGGSGRAVVQLPRVRRVVRRIVAVNIADSGERPRFCGSTPSSFSYVARRPLAGSLIGGFDARSTARLAYLAGCREGAANEFLGAVGGDSPGGDDDSDNGVPEGCDLNEGGEACGDEDSGPTISPTLTGSGTVTRDGADPNLYTYSFSFNEPVTGFRASVSGTNIRCPAPSYAEWVGECEALGNSNHPTAGSLTLSCPASEYTFEFNCFGPPAAGGTRGSTTQIPAGTAITGRFKIDAGTVQPSRARITGIQANNVEGQPFALSGP